MAWIYLILAGIFEVVWAVGLKYTDGFTRLWPTLIVIAFMAISIYLLALSARTIPIGTAYTVWAGLGAVGTVCVGIIWFSEPATFIRLLCVAMILTGVVGLKLYTMAN